jgi:hypothetical protein
MERKSMLFYSRFCFYCLGSVAFIVNIFMEVVRNACY